MPVSRKGIVQMRAALASGRNPKLVIAGLTTRMGGDGGLADAIAPPRLLRRRVDAECSSSTGVKTHAPSVRSRRRFR